MPIILWFRQDLRLSDNEALSAAAKSGEPIIPLYIHDENAAGKWADGGAAKWWLHHSLMALQKSLKADLVIREGDALSVLNTLIRETGAKAVYWNRQYEPYAIARDTKIKASLKEDGIDAQSFKGNMLFEPWQLQTGGGTPFRVFTPFYKAGLTKLSLIGETVATPKKITHHDKIKSQSIDDLKLLPTRDWADGFADIWMPGEDGANERARDFIDEPMGEYKNKRDIPGTEGTSRLSPHLHFGEVSARALWHAAAHHKGAEVFQRQLVWRDFNAYLLYHNPQMPEVPLQEKFAAFPWLNNDHGKYLRAWQRGMTGYPIVDAGMRQLWQTGWMHNRVRMIVGSFLVKHLLQPWQRGEEWFWDCLVDADLGNNAGNWQWIAGCGADAAPYFRVFNPIIQGEKFDPHGFYVREFVPELKNVPDKFIHKPWESGLKLNYPAPIVDHSEGRNRALAAYAKVKNNKE